jgi:hypothetical protein
MGLIMAKKFVLVIVLFNCYVMATAQQNYNNIYFPVFDNNIKYNNGMANAQNGMGAAEMGLYYFFDDTDARAGNFMSTGLLCLFYSGFSILMREAVYKTNPLDNWMGSVNSFVTMTGAGGGLGFLFALLTHKAAHIYDIRDGFLYFLGCTAAGILAGAIVHFAVPDIAMAFKGNRLLYYTAPAVSGGLGVLVTAISISLKIKVK